LLGGFSPFASCTRSRFLFIGQVFYVIPTKVVSNRFGNFSPRVIFPIHFSFCHRFGIPSLGASISKDDFNRCQPNWEGKPERIRLDQLATAWKNSSLEWVPTCKGVILAWLAHGAPCEGLRPRFGCADAHRLFEELTE
jgi:hypothetical protein